MSLARQKVGAAARRKDEAIAVLLQKAQACQALGRLDEAQAVYKKILSKSPDDFEILHLLGVGQHMAGDHEGAARSIRRALLINPKSAEAYANLGAVLRAANRLEEAVASYDQAVALDPNFANAYFNRGNALQSLGRLVQALESYDRAIALKPDHARAFCNRGTARTLLRQLEASLADFDVAIKLDPTHPPTWTYRGESQRLLGQFVPALDSFDKAIALNPNLVEPWLGAASVLVSSGQIVQAVRACERALAVQPRSAKAQMLLAQCHTAQGRPEAAVNCFDRALALEPDDEVALSNRIFTLDFAPSHTFAEHHRARTEWWNRVGAKVDRIGPAPDHDRDPERRIVLGYVSGDFHAISPAFAIRPILQNHDKSQFEVVCYSTAPKRDAVTESFQAVADRWHDASQWSDDELAAAIQADKVDILIDLSGHTQGNRLRVFARKLAPVQVTAWGHATGTGLPTIDYLFSDPVIIPEPARRHFAEKIWDLPCAIIVEPPSLALRSAQPPVLRNGYVTYGVFNRVGKFSDVAVSAWARILRSDPAARLIMKDRLLDDPSVRAVQLKRFADHGIAAQRLELIGYTLRDEHLKAYGMIDVCLDPFPSNGGVSTWEAAYMGVPVVSKLGESTSSRVGGAIMSAVGLPEFVAETEDDYVRIALAAKAERLQTLRRDLPDMIEASCGPKIYTRAVENAYRSMWQSYCATAEQP